MIKRLIYFVATTIFFIVLSSCDAPVVFNLEENPFVKTETTVTIVTDIPTEIPTMIPTKTLMPTPTSIPTSTALPTPEYLGFPMTPAGQTLTQIISNIEAFKSIEVVPCSNFSDEYKLLSNLPPVIYQGESWAESYCLDSLVIDREPSQEYSIFAAVVETWNMVGYRRFTGTEDGFYVMFYKTEYPRSDLEGVKGLELWNLLGIRKDLRLKLGRAMEPYILFGIDKEDYKEFFKDFYLYTLMSPASERELEKQLLP